MVHWLKKKHQINVKGQNIRVCATKYTTSITFLSSISLKMWITLNLQRKKKSKEILLALEKLMCNISLCSEIFF